MALQKLKTHDLIRIRRDGDGDWTYGEVVLASEKILPYQSVMLTLDGAVRAKEEIIAGVIPLKVDYELQVVLGLMDDTEYEIELAPKSVPPSELICDFCSSPYPTWQYPAKDFAYEAAQVVSTDAWTACDECATLIEKNDRDGLLNRAVQMFMKKYGDVIPDATHVWRSAHEIQTLFFKAREGSITRATPMQPGKTETLAAAIQRFDLPPEKYPLTIEALHPETKAVVWKAVVEGPGVTVIPPLEKQLSHPVSIRLTFADGEVHESPPEYLQ